MIKIFFTPQVALPGEKIEYSFRGEVLTASLRGKTDTFDFSTLPDGELDRGGGSEADDVKRIETTLPVCPVISARRTDGTLHLELLNWVDSDAPHESCFPEWVELPLPKDEVREKGKPEHLAVIPWRTAQELEAAKQVQQAEAQEREDRRARIKDGLITARTQEDLLALVRDMAAEMGFTEK